MAEWSSDIAALQADPTAKNMADPIKVYGDLAYCEALVTLESGVAANDTVKLFQVPANMRCIPEMSSVSSDASIVTSGVATVDVGDDDDTTAADADRYADGLDVAAAGVDIFDANASVARLTPYTTKKTCWIKLTFATLVTPIVGSKILVKMVFARL
jgi:hypothetical protein